MGAPFDGPSESFSPKREFPPKKEKSKTWVGCIFRIWLISNILLKIISFCFNERLPHHPLNK